MFQNFTPLKVPRTILFTILFTCVNSPLLKAQTIEEIGQNLAENLVQRTDIKASPYAIKIEHLFPELDPSEFEDSPAMFILAMLHGSELLLPVVWADLLKQADSLELTNQATYFHTYYDSQERESILITCVLKQESQYFAFSAIILEWEDEKFVMRLFKKMKVYPSREILEENIFSIALEEMEAEIIENPFPED
jgi:hypothetical protein